MSVQSWFNQVWYERASPPWWLVPFSRLYGAVSAARRRSFAAHPQMTSRVSCPVIVVGNLTVGGTGKTPLVCWLVSQLRQRGFRPGVVTRGYGGSSDGVRYVSGADDPRMVGDEPVLLARRSGVPVAMGRDRPAAARLLLGLGCNVIVSDDGLQHHALGRDCEIIVIDGDRRFGNGRLLPAGPLREPPGRLAMCDVVVVNGGRSLPGEGFGMSLEPHDAVALLSGEACPLNAFDGRPVHAVAAIGNPQRFFNMLRSRGIEVNGRPLADHARLTREDIEFGDDRPVLMTEKDAVKCASIAGPRHWYVPVSAKFAALDSAALMDVVITKIMERETQSRGLIDG